MQEFGAYSLYVLDAGTTLSSIITPTGSSARGRGAGQGRAREVGGEGKNGQRGESGCLSHICDYMGGGGGTVQARTLDLGGQYSEGGGVEPLVVTVQFSPRVLGIAVTSISNIAKNLLTLCKSSSCYIWTMNKRSYRINASLNTNSLSPTNVCPPPSLGGPRSDGGVCT